MSRPPIPEAVKREVRQRCKFGCVICGLPIYEYDHIFGYKEDEGHKTDEITLLCSNHHAEKTKGLMPLEEVIEANRDPYNVRHRINHPYKLRFDGNHAIIQLGDNHFERSFPPNKNYLLVPLLIDNVIVLGFQSIDNNLLLHLVLHDKSNQPLLIIHENELIYSTNTWDITFEGTNLVLREKFRSIQLDIVFTPPNKIEVRNAEFFLNGIEVIIRPDGVWKPVRISESSYIGNNNTIFICLGEFPAHYSAYFLVRNITRTNY